VTPVLHPSVQRFSALHKKLQRAFSNCRKGADTMPLKANRNFIVDADTGEVRCGDPCCAITQCGQCNKEQNKRKRAKRAEEAKAQKARDDEEACNTAREAMKAGKEHNWTFDREECDEGDKVLGSLQQQSDNERLAPALVGEEHAGGEQLEGIVSKDDVFLPEKSRGKTTWNHTTRMLLYKCIAKYNPFAAAVKKDAWNNVAIEMANATGLMHNPKTGDYRVKTDGHGLEVFYGRRVDCMKKVTAKEETNSGQAGTEITQEDAAEFAELQACVAKEKDAALIRDNKRKAKSALEDIKNNQVTLLVKQAALDDDKVKQRTFKLLQTKVRAAKLEAAVWEKQHGAVGKYAYSAAQLADMEYLTTLKKDFPEESDLPESDSGDKRRGGVAKAIGDLVAKLPAVSAPHVDVNQFAHAFFEAKLSYQARQDAPRKRSLADRLDDVRKQHAAQLITDEEKVHYETEIKKMYFMQD
jgi:hypothetical protein